MVVLGLFLIILAVFLLAIVITIVGINLVRRHRAGKAQPLLRFGIKLPAKTQLILGTTLIVLGVVFIFWIVWSGAEWVILRQ